MDIRSEIRSGKSIFELPLRVSYYARVSTDHELQATSIVNQVDYFKRYIDFVKNWVLIDGYVDEGISGKGVNKRDNFMRMIRDGKDNRFDLILTKSVSRFARNTVDSINYTNLLLSMGIGVLFLADNINTFDGDSEFRLTLMASIAQDEIRKLSDSVRFGLRQSINRGVVLGNGNILGYCKSGGKLVIDEEEALIVGDIFRTFDSGIYNYSEVSRIINNKYFRKFNSASIRRILTNPKYKGYYCGRKSEVIDYKSGKRRYLKEDSWVMYYDENIPVIVDEELWDRVNEVIRKRGKKSTYGEDYFSKVYCKDHGKMVVRRKWYGDRCYYYFRCFCGNGITGNLLSRVVGGGNVSKVLISRDDILRIDVYGNGK